MRQQARCLRVLSAGAHRVHKLIELGHVEHVHNGRHAALRIAVRGAPEAVAQPPGLHARADRHPGAQQHQGQVVRLHRRAQRQAGGPLGAWRSARPVSAGARQRQLLLWSMLCMHQRRSMTVLLTEAQSELHAVGRAEGPRSLLSDTTQRTGHTRRSMQVACSMHGALWRALLSCSLPTTGNTRQLGSSMSAQPRDADRSEAHPGRAPAAAPGRAARPPSRLPQP